jgi:uncharacterized integral membrane protein
MKFITKVEQSFCESLNVIRGKKKYDTPCHIKDMTDVIIYVSFLIIIIIKLILSKIRVRTVNFQIYEWQRATASGVETKRATANDAFHMKRATGSGAFAYYINQTRRCSSVCVYKD